MKIHFERREVAALAFAGVGTVIAASTDHVLGDVAGGLFVLLGGAGLVRSLRGKRAESMATPDPRRWRIATYAFTSLTAIGLLLFCSQFAVGIHLPLMWSAIIGFLVGILGLMVVAIRSVWMRVFDT